MLLEEKIKIINIKENESNKAGAEDKFNRVDIFVENDHGELLIIEITFLTRTCIFRCFFTLNPRAKILDTNQKIS